MRALALRGQHLIRPPLAGPVLNLDLTQPTLDPRIVFSRASAKTYFDNTGTLQSAASGVWPLEYDPVTLAVLGRSMWLQSTNGVRNPRGEGATGGITGPTNWSGAFTNSGLTVTPIGQVTVNGVPGFQYHITGTATATSTTALQFHLETTVQIAGVAGQTWTQSVYYQLAAGSLNGLTAPIADISFSNSSGAFSGNVTGNLPNPTAALQRGIFTGAISGATTAYIAPLFLIGVVSGATIDATINICGPQIEQLSFATPLILPPVGSPAASTRAGDAPMLATPSSINPQSFSVVVQAMVPAYPATGVYSMFSIDDGTTTNRSTLSYNFNQNEVQAEMDPSLALVRTGGIPAAGATAKAGIVVSRSALLTTYNGIAPVSVSPTGLPAASMPSIRIGCLSNGGQLCGYLKRLEIWSRPLSPAELKAATT